MNNIPPRFKIDYGTDVTAISETVHRTRTDLPTLAVVNETLKFLNPLKVTGKDQ